MYGRKSITFVISTKKTRVCVQVDKLFRICDFHWISPELRTFLLNKFRGRQANDELVIEKIENTLKAYEEECI